MNKTDILKLIKTVNDRYIADHPESGDCSWEKSCYFLGLAAAYEATKEKRYLDYIFKWAEDNDWNFYFGEPQTVPTYQNADYQFCGEIYTWLLDKLGLDKHGKKYIIEAETTLCDKDVDYWWWVDTIYMALPFYNMMGKRLSDGRFTEKAHSLYTDVRNRRKCYDASEHLWYRDERFLPGGELAPSGEKIFWGRGNGWVIGGLVRTLEYLCENDEYYAEYKEDFVNMAERLLPLISADGFWHVNLLNPEEYDCPESSGTALIAMSFLKGYNLGILDKRFYDAAVRAVSAIVETALTEDGRIGWTQGIAWGPTPVDENTTKDYVAGCFTICCCEMLKHIVK